MALMPDPDIAGHHGDKNTQTDGRVHSRGGERQQAQLKILEERRTAITAVCEPLTSLWFARPSVGAHSEIMTSLGDTNVRIIIHRRA